jgi:23S rRNA pseudouridine1911/1915/1917 synthase
MEILYEDNHLIVVNKAFAEIVQPDKTGDKSLEELIKQYLKEKYNKPGSAFLGVVHRIDRPVSGIVLFARTSKALSRLNQMFQEKEVKKTYWAIVHDKPDRAEDTLVHYLVRDPYSNKSIAYDREVKDSKKAVLSYKFIGQSDKYYLLEIDLQTGRHHQIRCQLAKVGMPIKGDLKYGYPRSNDNGGISLHSRQIEFTHPVTKELIIITANPPDDKLWNWFMKKSGS